jgi:hypothetical protein
MRRIKVLEKHQIYKFLSGSYFVHDSSKEATELAKKGPKFP